MKLEFKLAKCLLIYPSQTTPEQDCLVVDNQDKFVEPSSQIIWLDKYIKGICKFSSPIYAQIPWGEQVGADDLTKFCIWAFADSSVSDKEIWSTSKQVKIKLYHSKKHKIS